MITIYESYHKKNHIEIGEGKIVFVKKGNRTELEIKDIQNISLTDKKGEILFKMADGRTIKKNMLFISRRKELFYYIYWKGEIELDKEICQKFRLKHKY